MTDPQDSNDDWAELAREFALDKPGAPDSGREEPSTAAPDEGEALDAAPPLEGEDDGEEADDAGEGDGGPGTGRKRRRRRRRRRKGGAPGEAPAVAGDDEDADAPDPADAEPAVAEVDDAAPGAAEDDEAEEFDAEPAPLTAEEDTASEVLRELIATWNVPSWDSIVGGLYRPN